MSEGLLILIGASLVINLMAPSPSCFLSSVMHMAAKAGSLPVVDLLVKYGAPLDLPALPQGPLFGTRPLHLAAQQGHHQVGPDSTTTSAATTPTITSTRRTEVDDVVLLFRW